MAHDVFISYSSQDKAVADAACARLESRKIRCWIAPRDVPPIEPWKRILVSLAGATGNILLAIVFAFVVFLGPDITEMRSNTLSAGSTILRRMCGTCLCRVFCSRITRCLIPRCCLAKTSPGPPRSCT